MAYQPRPATPVSCAYCAHVFAARHARRRYCSKSCNVRASYARTGRRGRPVATLSRAATPVQEVPTPRLTPVAEGSSRPLPAPGASAAFWGEIERICHLVQHACRESQRQHEQRLRWLDQLPARWQAASTPPDA